MILNILHSFAKLKCSFSPNFMKISVNRNSGRLRLKSFMRSVGRFSDDLPAKYPSLDLHQCYE